MQIKKINLPLLILAGLLFLSFAFFVAAQENAGNSSNIFLDSDQDGLTDQEEKAYGTDPRNPDTDGDSYSDGTEVKSGYNPLKPAPGDKIVSSESPITNNSISQDKSVENTANLTAQFAQKISAITEGSTSQDQSITIDQIQSVIDESLNSQNSSEEQIPQITKDDIKIKKQNYGKLSDAKAKEKRKVDFENYLIAVYYIFSSNSPKPLTSGSDLSDTLSNLTQSVISAVSARNASSLENLSQSGEKILEQLKEVEVPEELVDIHLKALNFAEYTSTLKNNLNPITDDPIGDIARLSKIQNFLGDISNFASEVGLKALEYDLSYNDEIKNKLKSYGLIAPESQDLQNLISQPANISTGGQ